MKTDVNQYKGVYCLIYNNLKMGRDTNLSPKLTVDVLMSYQRMIFSTAKKYWEPPAIW